MRCHAPRKIFGGILEGNLKGAKSLGVLCEQLLVLIKMYRLRSGKSSSTPANTRPSNENSSSPELRQSTILFHKRRHPYAEAAAEDKLKTSTENLADHYSPPKRSKTAVMSHAVTRSQAKARAKKRQSTIKCCESSENIQPLTDKKKAHQPRSPLKEVNTTSAVVTEVTVCSPVGKRRTSGSPSLKEKDCGVDHSTPTQTLPTTPSTPARRVRKRLEFAETAQVKKSLHNSLPSTMFCREEQLATLTEYLTSHISRKRPGSLYISGAPGTGKTACLSHILKNSSDLFESVSVVTVNCMSMKQPQAIFTRIASELLGQKALKLKTMASLQNALVKYISTTKNMVMIVLDEVDQLDSKGQAVLYTLFEWPALPSSKLLLVGIANALDLTDRILPRLQSHAKCRPTLVHFPPYTKDQIVTILQNRLGSSDSTMDGRPAVIDPMALQFCARKVSAVHGDLRKALDICRRAVELAETKQRRTNADPSTPQTAIKSNIRVTLPVIASVISDVYTSNMTSLTVQQNFPLQQKLAVCTLLCMVKGRHNKEVTLGKLHDSYVRVCRHRQLRHEGETEFVGVCNMLETRGVISLKNFKAREARLIKVTLRLEEGDVEHALQDKVLLSSVLEQGIPPA